MNLTKRAIDSFKYQGDGQSRDVRWDDAMPGFGVRIYPSGRKAFILSYRTGGRKRLLTLGTYGLDLTLDEARNKARDEAGEVRGGGDPVAERRNGAMADTFAELAGLYLERHARPNKKSAGEDERSINKELIPHWGNWKATDIKRRDVIELLDGIKDRGSPVQANRVLALARKIFNFGIGRDIIEMNPCAQVPKPFKEQARQRVLSDPELKAVWSAFGPLGPIVGPMFKLRALTLQRGAEIASMRWDDIEGDWWTIPPEQAKNGQSHRVPLSPQAQEVLADLERYRDASGWVFPSPTRPTHISNVKKATERARQWAALAYWESHNEKAAAVVAGLRTELDREPTCAECRAAADFDLPAGPEDFRPHDLRRTGASKLTGLGIPRLVVCKILNHAEAGITSVYDRHGYDPEKRHALDVWGAYVEQLVTGRAAAGSVVELSA